MDKLRALQYFVAAAEEGSFSGAARRLDVSIPAVAKLVASLERGLGASLFDRVPQGLVLTSDGARYLDGCGPLLEQLAEADAAIGAGAGRPHGVLVVGAPAFVLQNCLGPALPRFHARYPDIELDLRIVNRVTEAQAESVDLLVLIGWHEAPDFIQKPIAHSRYVVLASPAYWSAHGMPRRPRELEGHQCFAFRNPHGTLLDLWEFERAAERESVKVRGWLASSHRNLLFDAALAGEGVVRTSDLLVQAQVRLGRLVKALDDWESLHAPPVGVYFRPKQRRAPRVRAFVDFAAEAFRRLEVEREGGIAAAAQRPEWYGTRHGRASRAARSS